MDILWIWSIWWFSHIYSTCIVWFPFPILHLHHWNQPSFFPRIPGPESAKPPIWSLAEGCWERSWVMMMMIAGMTLAIGDTSLVCLKFVKQLAPGKAPVLRARVNEVTCAWTGCRNINIHIYPSHQPRNSQTCISWRRKKSAKVPTCPLWRRYQKQHCVIQ